MKRLSLMILMTCASASSFASGIDSAPITDLSIKYLGQIFGNVPGALSGSGSGLLGGLFNIFNKGVMVVAAVWLMYTITQILIATATSDTPQKSIKNWMLWGRVVMGFALLVPGPSGYCWAQKIMMQVVEQGVNLADETWDYALNYMKSNTAIFPSPSVQTGGIPAMSPAEVSEGLKAYLGNDGAKPLASSMAYQLFRNEVCMYLSNGYNRANSQHDLVAKDGSSVNYQMISVPPVVEDNGSGKSPSIQAGTGVLYFPGYGDSNVDAPGLVKDSSGRIKESIPSNACGSYSMYSQLPTNGSSTKVAALTQYSRYSFLAIQQAAIDMEPYAIQVAAHIASPSAKTEPTSEDGAVALSNSVYDYLQIMQPIANAKQVAQSHSYSQFVNEASDQGWFNAGAFYWDLARWNDSLGTHQGSPISLVPALSSTVPAKINEQMLRAQSMLGQDVWYKAQSLVSQQSQAQSDNPNNAPYIPVTGMVTAHASDFGIISMPLSALVQQVSVDMALPSTSMNPLTISYSIGKSCLKQAGTMWNIAMASIVGGSLLLACCQSLMDAILAWIMPMLIAISGFLFVAGAMLTFYVPMYPYLLFLFGVVGWLLSVAEAMIAAPLVAFGMTHPEGHDFMGRAEQALMLSLGVFLRPALMVMGYIIGILMMYVCSGFLNQVLGRVFVSAFYTNQAQVMSFKGNALDGIWTVLAGGPQNMVAGTFTGNDIADAICVPITLVLYAMIMLEVTNQCFSAIHQIPDMVLRWVGSPGQQDQSAQHVQAIKGAMSSASQQGSQALSETSQGIAKGGSGMVKSLTDGAGDAAKAGMEGE